MSFRAFPINRFLSVKENLIWLHSDSIIFLIIPFRKQIRTYCGKIIFPRNYLISLTKMATSSLSCALNNTGPI